jgi:hypothetical protein
MNEMIINKNTNILVPEITKLSNNSANSSNPEVKQESNFLNDNKYLSQ